MQGATYMLPRNMEAYCVDLHGASQNARHPDHHGRQPVCHRAKGGFRASRRSSGCGHGRIGRSHYRVAGLLKR
eukprot:5998922-Prorocentrum_lima.AAC.1